jgi:phytanoyl-CoA hydroxylase
MYIFKQPNIGGEVTCHQDSTFLYTEPQQIVGLWFALEDASVENGCLWAIPGGHKLGLKSRWLRGVEAGMRFDVFDQTPWPEEKLIPLEVSKGSVIILNGLLPHKSLANRSSKSRHAYTLHVISGDCSYPETNWLQRSPQMPLRGFE